MIKMVVFKNRPCSLPSVRYGYESDLIIAQILVYAFFCGLVMVIILNNLYVPSVEVRVGL